MQIEILALRHQLAVLQRRMNKRPSLKLLTACSGWCFREYGRSGALSADHR